MTRSIVAVFLAVAIPWSLSGQAKRPSFEVASVKVNTAGQFPDFSPRRSGDRITMHNIRLPSVVIYAYHLAHELATTSYQLAGKMEFPEGSEVYDIDAIAPASTSDDDLRLMFQTLLEDRFHLKYHWETRELPMYDLVIAASGSKLKATVPGSQAIAATRPVNTEPGVSHLAGKSISMEVLVRSLAGRIGAPVRNLTGITGGAYDFDVPFARDGNLSEATSAPDLPRAVEQELGLKLKPHKGPVEVMVVDHLEKPSEN